MSDLKSNFWDERYSSEEYVYGMEPNQFFKQVLDKIPFPGKTPRHRVVILTSRI